ncbi:MAG: two-component regulator propeller domain-containing protein [Ignavibacteria bacterium]
MLKQILIIYIVLLFPFLVEAQTEEWKVFNTGNTGIYSNIISMAMDKSKVKWVLMKDGGIVKYDGNCWINYDLTIPEVPKSAINKIIIDKYDNMWFLTNGYGLVKYDGTNWTIYNTTDSGIMDNRITALAFDSLGNIWIGTAEKGLIKYDGVNWIRYWTGNSGLPGIRVNSIAIDRFNIKWIGTTESSGLAKFNDTTWVVYDRTNSGLYGANFIFIDNNDDIWVGGGGMSKFNRQSWTHYFASEAIIKIITQDKYNNTWIGFESNDFYPDKRFAMYFNGVEWIQLTNFNSSLPNSWVESIIVDSLSIFFALYDNSVAILRDSTWEIFNKYNTGINNDYIKSLALDKTGKIWIGTYGRGVVIHKSEGISRMWRNEIPGTFVHSLLVEDTNQVWAGTWFNGLLRYDGVSWNSFNTINSGIPSNNILCITSDSYGNKWIGTDNGLGKFDGVNWTVYNQNNSGLPGRYVSSIVIDKFNNKWIGTENGLAMFDGTNWVVYNTSNSGLPENWVLSLAIDSLGNKWIGTWQYGLVKFDGSNWTIYNKSNSGLPSNWIRVIKVDKTGNIWIGTENAGLAKYDGTSWSVYNVFNSGLSGNSITSIEIDELNHKIIGTHTGLSIYREGGVILDVQEEKVRPSSFVLYQNYPNPFNPTTKIKYSIKETGLVTLKVYDLLGREIATLVNEPKQAGEDEIEFDASKYNLPSGVYLYELRSGSFKSAKKFVLMK